MLLSSSADATHNALLWLYWRSATAAVAADDDATNAEAKVKVASVDITIADATF